MMGVGNYANYIVNFEDEEGNDEERNIFLLPEFHAFYRALRARLGDAAMQRFRELEIGVPMPRNKYWSILAVYAPQKGKQKLISSIGLALH